MGGDFSLRVAWPHQGGWSVEGGDAPPFGPEDLCGYYLPDDVAYLLFDPQGGFSFPGISIRRLVEQAGHRANFAFWDRLLALQWDEQRWENRYSYDESTQTHVYPEELSIDPQEMLTTLEALKLTLRDNEAELRHFYFRVRMPKGHDQDIPLPEYVREHLAHMVSVCQTALRYRGRVIADISY